MSTYNRSVAPSVGGIPVIGPWIARIGKAYDIVAQPCVTDPGIWINAAFYNIPKLAHMLFKPDPIDAAYDRFSQRHRIRRTGRATVNGFTGPDVPIPKGPAWANIKLLGDFAQRVGWYMIVIDATTEFLVNWTTTAYQFAGCLPGSPFPSEADNHAFPYYGPSDHGTLAWHTLTDPGNYISDSDWTIPVGEDATVTFTVTIGQPFLPSQKFAMPTLWVEDTFDRRYTGDTPLAAHANGAQFSGAQLVKFPRFGSVSRHGQIAYSCEGFFSVSAFHLTYTPDTQSYLLPDP